MREQRGQENTVNRENRKDERAEKMREQRGQENAVNRENRESKRPE